MWWKYLQERKLGFSAWNERVTDNENGESMESMEEVPLKGIDILRIFVFQKRVFF